MRYKMISEISTQLQLPTLKFDCVGSDYGVADTDLAELRSTQKHYSTYRVFGWNRNYEGIAVPIPAKHFINGVWLE